MTPGQPRFTAEEFHARGAEIQRLKVELKNLNDYSTRLENSLKKIRDQISRQTDPEKIVDSIAEYLYSIGYKQNGEW